MENTKIDTELSATSQPTQFTELVDLVKVIVQTMALVLIIRWSLLEPFKIPSTSMVPTLVVGDHILVNKLSYGFWLPFPYRQFSAFNYAEPKRGDIVVFTLPDDPETKDNEARINIIKRVMGLPGEKIEVRGTKVFINDVPIADSWSHWVHGGEKDFGPVIIPEKHVLMLGDNRDASRDSRFWTNPFLPIDRIKGRAFMIYWNSEISWDNLKRIFKIIR
ncbi:MAG: signal peptidase I [Deltaproteobacteria bacterium]|nr:signal peptidase I [Deltaproteobacteria bacterium]